MKMTTQELQMKCDKINSLKSLIDEAYAEMESIKQEIKSSMAPNEVCFTDKYKITNKYVSSTRIDSAALARDLPDVAKKYMVESSYTRLYIN